MTNCFCWALWLAAHRDQENISLRISVWHKCVNYKVLLGCASWQKAQARDGLFLGRCFYSVGFIRPAAYLINGFCKRGFYRPGRVLGNGTSAHIYIDMYRHTLCLQRNMIPFHRFTTTRLFQCRMDLAEDKNRVLLVWGEVWHTL